MLLHDVSTRAFRNLADQRVELAPNTTVLYGQNGQGKTNFLEACYLLCTLRPLRAQKLLELVRFGAAGARVRGRFELPGGEREVEVAIEDGKRAAQVDGKPVRDPTDLFGGLAVVAFTPDDLNLLRGGPDGRRRLLDRAVQNRHPHHLADARDYLRALKSRNQLLRERAAPALIEAFDEPLARLGTRIRARREELLGELRALRSQPSGAGEELRAALTQRLERDRERGFTSVGPHADELWIGIGERAARLYASQGQARAVMLAFKIAEIENLRAAQGRAPLLLLDDVSSELDPDRNRYLMEYLKSLAAQVVLTTTDAKLVATAAGPDALFYAVRAGCLQETKS